MWSPEARDSSPIVFTLVGSWKEAATGLDEVCGFRCGIITSVRIPLPHFFAWTLELELELKLELELEPY